MNNFLFELKEGLSISLKAILANKTRSILTTIGIVIGIWAVVTMSTAIKAIDQSFQTGVASLGSDNLYVDKYSWFSADVPFWEMRNRKNIDYEDFERFKKQAKLPVAVAPSILTRQTLKYEQNSVEFITILGTTNDYLETSNLTFDEGRFFNQIETNGKRNVCVIGSEIYKRLFPDKNGLGKDIRIRGRKFKVIGVLKEQGSWVMGNFNPDNQVFVPIGVIFKYFRRHSFGTITINVRAANSEAVEATKDEAIEIMRRVRGLQYDEKNNFSVNQQDGLLDAINQTVGVIQVAGYFITALSLIVGAIGIMNIMFVSVKERTREIGIRKAIGAKRKTILTQFISESAFICLLGGLIGLILSIISAMILQQFMPTSIQVDSVILAIFISLLTGVVSGFAPAYTAAKMDPVDALRYE